MDDIEDLRLLRRLAVHDLVGLSASRIEQMENAGEFPRRINIGKHSVAYRAKDIRAWIESRIATGKHEGKGATAKKPKPAPASKPVKVSGRTPKKGGQ